MRDRLAPQDGLYSVADPERARASGCGSSAASRSCWSAPEDPAAVVRRIADPTVAVVSLTVTEKGYCHDPASGALLAEHPDIRHDLAHPDAPRSVPGVLVAGLARRRAAGAAPPTVLSCDNLPGNGATLRGVVARVRGAPRRGAGALDRARGRVPLHAWSIGSCRRRRRPTSQTSARAPRRRGRRAGGCRAVRAMGDRGPLLPARGRPGSAPGAELVAEVAPYEEMKLRLLNGSHSALAYLGYLAGFEHVVDVMGVPDLVTFMRRMMAEEVAPTLRVPTDLAAYQASLLERFANPAIRHRTARSRCDGSQKLPQRLLGTIRDQLRAGGRDPPSDASRSRPGCATPPAATSRAGRSRSPTRWPGASLRSAPRPAATLPRWRRAFSRFARCSATICRARRASRRRSPTGCDLLLTRGARATVAECVRPA